jgi:hypothetical protein
MLEQGDILLIPIPYTDLSSKNSILNRKAITSPQTPHQTRRRKA